MKPYRKIILGVKFCTKIWTPLKNGFSAKKWTERKNLDDLHIGLQDQVGHVEQRAG